jgi:hypothetical protein
MRSTPRAGEETGVSTEFGDSSKAHLWDRIDENSPIDVPTAGTSNEGSQHNGCSFTVRCSKMFNFSVQEFSTESLARVTHSAELEAASSAKAPSGIWLNVDPYLMGIGGDDSWTACVHDSFTLQPKPYDFKVSVSFHYS